MNRLRTMLHSLGTIVFLNPSVLAQVASATPTPAITHTCDNLPHSDHPRVRLGSDGLSAVVFLADAKDGFYRGSRFDWAGVIGCVSLRGHTFFGEWFPRYDPLLNDAVTGPVEEFRAPSSELAYDDPTTKGRFLKIGVGVLRKINDAPYTFGGAYSIVETGERTISIKKRSVTFVQILKTDFGYSYRYEKTVSLDKHGDALTLTHQLKNLGARTIETNVYDHDFFMLDNQPTGPGMVVHLGFPPVPEKPFPETASIHGNDIVFEEAPTRRNSPQGYLTGYTGKAGEYSIIVEDKNTHLVVKQTSPSPIAKFYFWSTPKTICPEAYIHIDVAPGKTQSWEIHYRFTAP